MINEITFKKTDEYKNVYSRFMNYKERKLIEDTYKFYYCEELDKLLIVYCVDNDENNVEVLGEISHCNEMYKSELIQVIYDLIVEIEKRIVQCDINLN